MSGKDFMRLRRLSVRRKLARVNKAELRTEMRARLRSPELGREEKSRALNAVLAAHRAFQRSISIALFSPLPVEPALDLFAERGDRRFCFPLIRAGEIVLIRVDSPDELLPSEWHPHIREPAFRSERVVQPNELDLVIVPGLAFTATGARLGRGGGFYDRLLAKLSPRTVRFGVCFSLQLVSELPLEPHDQLLDAVITEDGVA